MEDMFSGISAYRKWLSERDEPFSSTVGRIADRIEEIDGHIGAFMSFDRRKLEERGRSLEEEASDPSSLRGVPVGVKSNICIRGELTTCASRILDGFRPPYDATVIEKLSAEGALIAGGLNMDEFAFGSSCENSAAGPTRNPWDMERIPGGSSGGSAAAVSSGEVVCAIGSDTGGSIRQPASMCGVVGMKPTYGRVSRYGLIAFASSLDQIGPLTRNVEDCARMLEVISGYDEKDSTSVNAEVPRYTDILGKGIKGLRIGIPREYFTEGIEAGVRDRVNEAIEVMKELGAETVEISLPHTKYAVSCYYIIGPAEASSNLARFDGVQYGYRAEGAGDIVGMYTETRSAGFGPEAKRRILLGTYALSSGYYEAYYLKAQKVRTKISGDFKEAFELCDSILTPTSPTTAFRLGERLDDPLTMYLSDVFTIPANLAGLPAVSIPCGTDDAGLPVGLQLMARPFDEEMILRIAHAYEEKTGYDRMFPPACSGGIPEEGGR